MDIQNNKLRNGSSHAQVNFSQSEKSSFMCWGEGWVGGWVVKILVTTGGDGIGS